MKNTNKLIITILSSTLTLTISAQVKQVFKVVDFDTKLPVAGATTMLYGQALTTNAQGVAVASLPADKKGAFLPLEQWKKEGLVYVGRAPESLFGLFQTNDTLKFYMTEKQQYRKAAQNITVIIMKKT